MGVTLDDLQTFYAQKQAERAAAAVAPAPVTALEFAQTEIAAIGAHDAITTLLDHLVAAVGELADRVAALEPKQTESQTASTEADTTATE